MTRNMWPCYLGLFFKLVWCTPVTLSTSHMRAEKRLVPYPGVECGDHGHLGLLACTVGNLLIWCFCSPLLIFPRSSAWAPTRQAPEHARVFGFLPRLQAPVLVL